MKLIALNRSCLTILTFLSFLPLSQVCANSNENLVMDFDKATGLGVAVWMCQSETHRVIQAATYNITEGWGTPETISDLDFDAALPTVSMNENGDAVALWVFVNSTYDIVSLGSATLESGGSWTPPVMLSGFNYVIATQTLNLSTAYSVSVSNAGDIVATWTAYSGTNHQIYSTTGTLPGWTDLTTVPIAP